MERITSRTNPLIAHIRKLANDAAYRRAAGAFVCDGPKLLQEALRWGRRLSGGAEMDGSAPPAADSSTTLPVGSSTTRPADNATSPASCSSVETVLFSDAAFPGGAGLPPIPDTVRLAEVPENVFSACSPSKTPQGVLCVCAMRNQSPPRKLDGRRYLVLDGVQDPGNVGTMLRTADAFGADALLLLPGCADLYHPRTVRASMGALFRLPAWTCSVAELRDLMVRSDMPLYGAALSPDAQDPRRLDLFRCAFAVGSEGRGLSAEVLDLCTEKLRIPMRERCESLNVGTAAAVLLWEAARRIHAERTAVRYEA